MNFTYHPGEQIEHVVLALLSMLLLIQLYIVPDSLPRCFPSGLILSGAALFLKPVFTYHRLGVNVVDPSGLKRPSTSW